MTARDDSVLDHEAYTDDEFYEILDNSQSHIRLTRDIVTEYGAYRGNPVAILDTWQFGGSWECWADTDLIIVDRTTWNHLSPPARRYLLAHEHFEQLLGKKHRPEIQTEELSPTTVIARYHEEANRRAVAAVGEDAATTYSKEVHELELNRRDSDLEQANHQATYVLKGVEEHVPDEYRVPLD